jgi:hypothetical protein
MPLSEDPDDKPLGRLPYERHRREPAPTGTETTSADSDTVNPLQWRPVRRGLTIAYWGWVALFCCCSVAALFVFLYLFKFVTNENLIHWLKWGIGSVALSGFLAIFTGECLCLAVPRVARIRGWATGAVVFLVILAIGVGVNLTKAEPLAPFINPTPIPPATNVNAPNGESPLPGKPFFNPTKLFILGAFLISQMLFTHFLKRVALLFHNEPLAESTGSYLALLIFHTALLALLPPEAMIACFFWVIMLALQFVLMAWFLNLLAKTRKAIG